MKNGCLGGERLLGRGLLVRLPPPAAGPSSGNARLWRIRRQGPLTAALKDAPPPALVSSGLSRYGLWPGPVEGGAAGSTLVFRDFAARDWGSYLISTTPTQLRVFGDSSRMLIWTRFPLYKFLLLAQSLNSSVNVKAPGTRGPLPWAVHFRRPLERGDW